jgi:phosphatidyl-myo-inositol alpha-mannosyltransferase
MRIAFYSKQLPSDAPNGVSVQVHRLANELVRLGHSVTCFSFSPCPDDAAYTVEQLKYPNTGKIFRKLIPAIIFAQLRQSGFDIYHYHGDDYLCLGNKRRIRTFYGSALFEAMYAERFWRSAYQAVFYMFEWVSSLRKGMNVGISAATCRALPLVHRYIPCGVPLNRYFPSGEKTAFPSILFIGDFKSRKRGELLVSAFKKSILPAYVEAILTVIGPASITGPGVRCLGNLSEQDLIAEYRKHWVVCIPSSYEGFGVPAIEAMACGTVVIATENAGIREIICDGKNGMLCKPENLGKAICRLLDDAELCTRLITRAAKFVESYDMKCIAGRYVEAYTGLIGKAI